MVPSASYLEQLYAKDSSGRFTMESNPWVGGSLYDEG